MKSTRFQETTDLTKNPPKISSKENKQNMPFHPNKQNKGCPILSKKKLGQQIKNRITKIQEITPAAEALKSQKMPIILKEDINSLNRNVSFHDYEKRDPSIISKNSSKKSILKTSRSNSSLFNMKKSQISLTNSHMSTQDQSIENINGNKSIKEKYQHTFEKTKKQGKKYTDEIYPPVQTSLYLNNSLMKNFCATLKNDGRHIQWKRLSEIYKKYKIVVWTSNQTQKSLITKGHITKHGGDGDFLPTAFNSIRDKKSILEKMFESQNYNPQGIYYVKIYQTQTNIWKYLVIDDYIPIIVNQNIPMAQRYSPQNIYPAFLNVAPRGNVIQIWPFLLQKAYAKYYSTYDSLANGNTLDFVEQITGKSLDSFSLLDKIQQFKTLSVNEDALVLGEDRNGYVYPIKCTSHEDSQPQQFIYLDRDRNFTPVSLSLQQFTFKFSRIHYTEIHQYYFSSKCQIQLQSLKNKSNSKQGYILRHFTIDESSACQIVAVQKQQRFYRSMLTYQYAWMRMILVQKERNGFRWIDGAYSNKKSTKISANLTAGQYAIILLPQWKSKAYDFNLIFNGNTATKFQRKNYEEYKHIIEQSSMDLAQRYGELMQINKNICSYIYKQHKIGVLIENVNNEKQQGHVKIVRSIEGLENYNIMCLNEELKLKRTAQIVIPFDSHFTVVLMTRDGVQPEFIQNFDFGFK